MERQREKPGRHQARADAVQRGPHAHLALVRIHERERDEERDQDGGLGLDQQRVGEEHPRAADDPRRALGLVVGPEQRVEREERDTAGDRVDLAPHRGDEDDGRIEHVERGRAERPALVREATHQFEEHYADQQLRDDGRDLDHHAKREIAGIAMFEERIPDPTDEPEDVEVARRVVRKAGVGVETARSVFSHGE